MASRRAEFIRAPPQFSGARTQALPADGIDARNVLSCNGLALAGATTSQAADRLLVLTAVQQEGLALQFASKDLRADSEIVRAAAAQNPRALRHAVDEVRLSTALLPMAVRESNDLLFRQTDQTPPRIGSECCSFVFVLDVGGKEARVRGKLADREIQRLPLLQAILEASSRGFGCPEADRSGAVIVRIPVCASVEELRAFFLGRRASVSDFVLADFFGESALRHAAIAYLKECRSKSFEGSLHNFLTAYPALVRLLCQLGPDLWLPGEVLNKLFAKHCFHIPAKRQKCLDQTITQIARGPCDVTWPCSCCACKVVAGG